MAAQFLQRKDLSFVFHTYELVTDAEKEISTCSIRASNLINPLLFIGLENNKKNKKNKTKQKAKISVRALNQTITTFHSPLARGVNIFLFKLMTEMNMKEVKYRNEIKFN